MTLEKYLDHYLAMPDVLYMAVVALVVLVVMHGIIIMACRGDKAKLLLNFEMYYEMLYSATAMLFFIGLYFLVTYRYFDVSESFYKMWNEYEDLLLLLAIVLSIVLINIIDTIIVPLRTITGEHKATLRILAMMYMLIIFAYIKFIYEDNNYDAIISYFIIMVIGRFVYFDASFKDFWNIIKGVWLTMPMLFLALATSGILAWYGFGSEYLLKKNGVVLSLGIAHLFVIIAISIAHHVERLTLKTKRRQTRKKRR